MDSKLYGIFAATAVSSSSVGRAFEARGMEREVLLKGELGGLGVGSREDVGML